MAGNEVGTQSNVGLNGDEVEIPYPEAMRAGVKELSVVRRQRGFDSFFINSLAVNSVESRGVDDLQILSGFLESILDSYGINDAKLRAQVIADKELSGLFIKLTVLELEFSKDKVSVLALREKIREKVLFYVVGRDNQPKGPQLTKFDKVYSSYFYVKRMEELRNRIFATGNASAIAIWDTKVALLNESYNEGKLKNFNEYLDKLELIFAESIVATGDESLEEDWGSYKKSDARGFIDDSFVSTFTSEIKLIEEVEEMEVENKVNEKPAPNEKVVETVDTVNNVEGFSAKRAASWGVVVNVGGYFSVNVDVYINSSSGEYVFYLNDDYMNGGEERVKPDELLLKLFERHIDGRISKKLSEDLDFVPQIARLPDKDIVSLGKAFLGEKGGSDFKMSPEDLEILDKLVELLKKNDDNFPTLAKKVEALNDYLMNKSKADFARRALIEGKIISVNDIINS